jgi:hypothetical protein
VKRTWWEYEALHHNTEGKRVPLREEVEVDGQFLQEARERRKSEIATGEIVREDLAKEGGAHGVDQIERARAAGTRAMVFERRSGHTQNRREWSALNVEGVQENSERVQNHSGQEWKD